MIQTARELGALVSRGNHDDAALAGWHLRQRGNSVKPKLDCGSPAHSVAAAGCALTTFFDRGFHVCWSHAAILINQAAFAAPQDMHGTAAGVTQLKPQDVAWLEELPFSVSLPDYRLVIVHAGLVPLVPLKRQQMINMSKMRDLRLRPDGRCARWCGGGARHACMLHLHGTGGCPRGSAAAQGRTVCCGAVAAGAGAAESSGRSPLHAGVVDSQL